MFDPRTEKNLATLDFEAEHIFRPFIQKAKDIAATYGCEFIAISGNRTWDEQNALYAQGRTKPGKVVTNARGGYSSHNFKIALDFGVFRKGKYLDNDDPKMASIVYKAVSKLKDDFEIDWGGDWKSFPDEPHFEVRTGLSTAKKRERFSKLGTVL